MSPATSGIDCTSDPSQGPNGTQKGHFRSGFGDGDGSVEDVTVRPATADDLPAVLAMKNAAWRETYAHVLDDALLDRLDARLDEQVEGWRTALAQGARVWLAEEAGGVVVGMAATAPRTERSLPAPAGANGWPEDLPETVLTSLYVLARAHGTGLGHRLHEAALGDIPAVLRVLEGNERAVRFYRGHGYAPVGDPEPIGGAWGDAREQLMVRP